VSKPELPLRSSKGINSHTVIFSVTYGFTVTFSVLQIVTFSVTYDFILFAPSCYYVITFSTLRGKVKPVPVLTKII
jgi:hypothetical protein